MRPPKRLTVMLAISFYQEDLAAGRASPNLDWDICARYLMEAAHYTAGMVSEEDI